MNDKKKNILNNVFNNFYYTNDALIYKFLKDGTLDKLINKINNRKTKCPTSNFAKKEYLTSEEQFLDVLNNFIIMFDKDFYFLGQYRTSILNIVLHFDENYKFLLSKNYCRDNSFITYYEYSTKKYIITGFFNTIKLLYSKSYLLQKLLSDEKINPKYLNLKKKENVNKLYELLRKLALANANEYHLFYIFNDLKQAINKKDIKNSNKKKESTIEKNIFHFEVIIYNYNKKKKFINMFL